jgi:predicted ATPase
LSLAEHQSRGRDNNNDDDDDDNIQTGPVHTTQPEPGNFVDEERNAALKQLGLIFVRILRVLARTLATVPVVLVVEDLQWADAESLDLISTLVGEKHLDNILLVATFREDDATILSRQDMSPAILSVYSIVMRKNVHKLSRQKITPQVVNPPSLSSAQQTFSISRPLPKIFAPNHFKSRNLPFSDGRNGSTGFRLPDATVASSNSSLRRAVTLGSYVGPPNKTPPSISASTSIDDSTFEKKSGPRTVSLEPTRPSMPGRSLSLIIDDESEADDVFPSTQAIALVPPPVSFGKEPCIPDLDLPTLDPAAPPSLSNPTNSMFSHSRFQVDSRRDLSTRSITSNASNDEIGSSVPPTGSPARVGKEDRGIQSMIPTLTGRESKQGSNLVTDNRHAASLGSRRRANVLPGDLSTFLTMPPPRSQSFAASMFGKLSNVAIGRRLRSVDANSSKFHDADQSDSTHVDLRLPNNPESLFQILSVVDVCLGIWDIDVICEYLSSLLNLEAAECRSLSEVIEKKTKGNPNSVMKFVEFLEQDGLLDFSMKNYRWEWDSNHIDAVAMATSDVGELLAARVNHLPSDSLSVLKMAACIGISFEERILGKLMAENAIEDAIFGATGSVYDLNGVLLQACDAGLLEKVDDSVYRFSHDLVQQNLYSQIEESSLCVVHFCVAKALQSTNAPNDEFPRCTPKDLYSLANHFFLGKSAITSESERVEVCELQLQASAAAKDQGSFRAAAIFLERAITDLFRTEDWSHNYSLILEAYSSAAEILFSCGDLDKSVYYAELVIQNGYCVEERLRGYFVKIDVLTTERRFTAAIDESFKLLDVLGCHIPRRWKRFRLRGDLRKIRKALAGKTLSDLSTMKPMRNVLHLAALRIMDTMTLLLALRGDDEIGNVILTKMVRTTLKSGISVYAPYSLAGYGMLLIYSGDMNSGYHYGDLSLRFAESFRSKRALVRTAFLVYTFLSWTQKPLAEGIEVMLNAHRMGMQVGDLEYSSMCL